MPNDDLEEKRRQAQAAMESAEHAARRNQTEAEIAKRRKEAMKTMESAEHKQRREAEEKLAADLQAAEEARLAEINRLREMEAKRKQDAENKKAEEAARIEADRTAHVEKIHRAEADISNIKEAGKTSLTSVRTLQSDLNQAVERRKISATTIGLSNQDHPDVVIIEHQKTSAAKIILTLLLALILIGGGGGAIWYAYNQKTLQGVPVPVTVTPKLLTAEKADIVTLSTSTPPSTIQADIRGRLAEIPTGAHTLFFKLTGQSENAWLNPTELAALANLNIPDGLLRATDNLFTMGTIQTSSGGAQFIILKIKTGAYDRALARTLDWEETIARDLSVIWPIDPELATAPFTKTKFIDKRVANLDARVLYSSTGQPAIIYTLFNNTTIVIATTELAIPDLIGRIAP